MKTTNRRLYSCDAAPETISRQFGRLFDIDHLDSSLRKN